MTKPENGRNVRSGCIPDLRLAVPLERTEQDQRTELGDRIDRVRRQQRMTIADLALKAGYDERTVRNVLSGKPTKPRTMQHICEAVGIKDASAHTDLVEFADESHGAYCEKTTALYAGNYEAFRWSYDQSGNIVRSVFELAWSPQRKCMLFKEHQRYMDDQGRKVDFTQEGDFYSSGDTGLVHLLTVAEGKLRMITLTKLERPDLVMKGVVLTQARMSFYRQPAISPLLLRKTPAPLSEAEISFLMGEVSPGDGGYAVLARDLREIEREVVLSTFATGFPDRGQQHRPGRATQLEERQMPALPPN